MKRIIWAVAAGAGLLLLPGGLFMAALVVRAPQPAEHEPARTARAIVAWYSARRLLGLEVFLVALPLAALVLGGATLRRAWLRDPDVRRAACRTLATLRAHAALLAVAATTLLAAGILAIVALHVLAD